MQRSDTVKSGSLMAAANPIKCAVILCIYRTLRTSHLPSNTSKETFQLQFRQL